MEGEREGDKYRWFSDHSHAQLQTWPATQACALTGNGTSNFSALSLMLYPLGHTSWGCCCYFK